MAFRLRQEEPFGTGVKRNARRQIEKSLALLRAGDDPNETVRAVRRRLKRVRAILRLTRPELREAVYERENLVLRDAGRLLGDMRDASILVETLDWLTDEFSRAIKRRKIRSVRKILTANRREVTQHAATELAVFVKVTTAMQSLLPRLDDWTTRSEGCTVGLQHVYAAGHHAMAVARANPSGEALHEWRKEVRYLWHVLNLLEPMMSKSGRAFGEQVHTLSRLLGRHHDLATLRKALDADPLAFGGFDILENVFELVDRVRLRTEQQAFELGQRLYRDDPADFLKHLKRSWPARKPHE